MAAGAEIKETRLFQCEHTLQELIRKYIRNHLKHIHPEGNLYTIIPQLGLPERMQAYLLFYMLRNDQTNMRENEEVFWQRITEKDVDSVLSLVKAGVDVNIRDNNGMTALMKASENGHVQLVEELIKFGANMNLRNLLHDTALIYAAKEGNLNCVQKLIDMGANVNIQDVNGKPLCSMLY